MNECILHIITRLDRGGSADLLLKLAAEQRQRGYPVSIISGLTTDPVIDYADYQRQTGIGIESLNCLQREVKPWLDLLALWRLWRLLRQRRPQIVHLHTAKAGFIGRLAARAAGLGGVVYTTHGHIFHGYFSKAKTGFFIMLEKLGAACGGIITTLSEAEKQDFLIRKIAPAERIIPVPNGLNLAPFNSASALSIRDEFAIGEKTPIVGWVGRFEPVKGPEFFLELCHLLKTRYHKELRALMVGDGALMTNIRERAIQLGLEDFLLISGFRQNIVPVFMGIDILVVTSINEGFGLVILEAMAAGKPVIAHGVGGIPELITDGETGFLVDPGDTEAIYERLTRLLDNIQLSQAMGQAAKKRAAAFSMKTMADRFDLIYGQLCRIK